MADELIERLRRLRTILKSGEYDGADLMRAWCAMMDAADEINCLNDALAKRVALHTSAIMDRDNAHVAGVKAAIEDAEQRCRYVAKHVADRMEEGEARDTFELACQLCADSIARLIPEDVVAKWLRESRG